MIALTIAAVLFGGAGVYLAWLIRTAHLGFEDERGWHPGEPNTQPDTALDTPRADLCTPAALNGGGGVFSAPSHEVEND